MLQSAVTVLSGRPSAKALLCVIRRRWMGAQQSTDMASPAVRQSVDTLIKANKVMIFSKTTCPFCTMAKNVFREIGENYNAVELDQEEDGSAMQAYLAEVTGARTVPRVFIKGECIGGGSETKSLYNSGKLKSMLV